MEGWVAGAAWGETAATVEGKERADQVAVRGARSVEAEATVAGKAGLVEAAVMVAVLVCSEA